MTSDLSTLFNNAKKVTLVSVPVEEELKTEVAEEEEEQDQDDDEEKEEEQEIIEPKKKKIK